MLYTVTLNPTLDKTLAVPALIPGTIHRAETIRYDLGGKGINVSRALRALDLASVCFGVVAGHNGRILRDGLHAQGYVTEFVEIQGETRQNITLLDRAKNEYTKLNEAGPVVTPHDLDVFFERIAHTIQAGDLCALCGSLPPGAPTDTYARLIQHIQNKNARAFLDTSGAPLLSGFAARPYALKVNAEEAGELLGRSLLSDESIADAVREFRRTGIALVIVTRGAQGIVLGINDALVFANPPQVETRSAVGAGDAALAGLLWAVTENCDAIETARRVTACGTAAAMQEGSGVGERALIATLTPHVKITLAA